MDRWDEYRTEVADPGVVVALQHRMRVLGEDGVSEVVFEREPDMPYLAIGVDGAQVAGSVDVPVRGSGRPVTVLTRKRTQPGGVVWVHEDQRTTPFDPSTQDETALLIVSGDVAEEMKAAGYTGTLLAPDLTNDSVVLDHMKRMQGVRYMIMY